MSRFGTRSAGFTLLEILVVVVILAVMTGVAVITLRGSSPEERLDTDADRLAALIEAGCEQALLEARPLGLRLTPGGYDFWWPGTGGGWTPAGDDMLRPRTLTGDWTMRLEMEGRPVELADSRDDPPQIVCSPTGEFTPFELRLAAGDTVHVLQADFTGPLEVEKRHSTRP